MRRWHMFDLLRLAGCITFCQMFLRGVKKEVKMRTDLLAKLSQLALLLPFG